MSEFSATVVQYKRDDDNEIIRDYHRDENGKRLPGDEGKEKYLQTETISTQFTSELELATYVRDWARDQASDSVIVWADEIQYEGSNAITWAQKVCDIADQQSRVLQPPKIKTFGGKRYVEIVE